MHTEVETRDIELVVTVSVAALPVALLSSVMLNTGCTGFGSSSLSSGLASVLACDAIVGMVVTMSVIARDVNGLPINHDSGTFHVNILPRRYASDVNMAYVRPPC